MTPQNLTSVSITAYLQTDQSNINLKCVLMDQNNRTTSRTVSINLHVVSNLFLYVQIENLDVSSSRVTFQITDGRMLPWSPENPNLQTLNIAIGSDSITVRFGVNNCSHEKEFEQKVKFIEMRILGKDKNQRITLNGKVVKLLGVNRHTMFPDSGSNQRIDQIEKDIKLLKDMNVNYV